jgi:small GTP-binding protein
MDFPRPCPRISVKAVLLGDSGVGKTSLATRWTTGFHHQPPASTVGANHHKKRMECENEQVDVFLWDTAGQEQYQALTPLYVRCAAVAILVTVIDDPETFNHISYWKNLLITSTDVTPPILLAVNKVDTVNEAVSREEEIQAEYAGQFDGVVFVSAVTNEGVDNLFSLVTHAGYKFVKATGMPQIVRHSEEKTKCCRSG